MKNNIIKFLDYWEESILIGSLVFSVVLVFIQVIMRYVFNSSLSWSEELARYIFIWQCWLAIGIGTKYRKHIRIEFLKNSLSKNGKKILEIIVIFITMSILVYLIINGSALAAHIAKRGATSPALNIPLEYIYASVPVGCSLMAIRLLQQLYGIITGKEEIV